MARRNRKNRPGADRGDALSGGIENPGASAGGTSAAVAATEAGGIVEAIAPIEAKHTWIDAFLLRRTDAAFNILSVSIGLSLLVVWSYVMSVTTTVPQVRGPQTVLFLGFGAIFTLFVVRFACVEPALALAGAIGIAAGGAVLAAPSLLTHVGIRVQGGALLNVAAFAVGAGAAAGAHFLLKRIVPRHINIRGNELAIIYAIVVIGAATSLISRATFQAAGNLWRDEYQLDKWIPPHWLPAPNARDDVPGIAYGARAEAPADAAAAEAAIAGTHGPRALPEKGAKTGFFEGHAQVPWWSWFVSGFGHGREPAEWTFPGIFWIILLLTFEFFFLFLVLVFRRRWIEEERLPFPLAQMPLSIINDQPGGGGLFRNRTRIVAFGIGFALTIAAVLSISPTNALQVSPLQFLFTEAINTRIDLTGYSLIPDALTIAWFAPLAFLVMLFAPVDVLLTSLLTFFVVQVALRGTFKMIGSPVDIAGNITRGITLGGAAGLAFWTLVFQWKSIERLFAAFIRNTKSAADAGILTARNLLIGMWLVSLAWVAWVYPAIYGARITPATRWLMLAGTGLVFAYLVLSSRKAPLDESDDEPVGARSLLLLIAAMGISFVALTLPGRSAWLLAGGAALTFAYTFGSIRARGETPLHEFYEYDQGRIDASIQARYIPGPTDPGNAAFTPEPNRWWNTPPGVMSQFYTWHIGTSFRRWGPQNAFFDTFKVGHETGASARDVFKAIVLAMVVAAVLTPILTLRTTYRYGHTIPNAPTYWYEDYVTDVGEVYIFGTSSMEPPTHMDKSPIYVWPVIGFFVLGAIMYMRREYVWFPLHPVGFVLGAWMYQAFGSVRDMWLTLLVAYLVKRLIFKWFGVRFFRERVQPVLVFAVMGIVMGIVLYLVRYAVSIGIGVFK